MKLPLPRFTGPLADRLRRPHFDAERIERTIQDALSTSRLDLSTGPLKAMADTVRRALTAAASGATVTRTGDAAGDGEAAGNKHSTPGGKTVGGTHLGVAGSRSYQLYVPARPTDAPALIVMLHGCTQSPDDFAAGTRMNEIAEREGFLVVYPAQSPNANGSKCWNWFRSQDQGRDGGEPSLIAGIVRDVAALHRVDPRRIFVAGLSAGGAMAVILGHTYPELFRAVGVHSGLAYAAAHDVPSAFSAMGAGPVAGSAGSTGGAFVPTIVFHGDRDKTVHAGNGDAVAAQALRSLAAAEPAVAALQATVSDGTTPAGARYTRMVHADDAGRPRVEHWVVHGAGHAWAGGSSDGSYTAPDGPDASEAMVRFFLAQAGTPRDER